MIRVLQFGMTSNIGGIETYLIEQHRHLNKSEICYDFVNIASEKEIAFKDEILESGGKIYNITPRHKNPIRHYYEILNLINDNKHVYDAIVLNTCSLTYLFPITVAMIFNIPIRIIHSHNAGQEPKRNFLFSIISYINKKIVPIVATDLWACSEKAGRWMFGNRKYKIIPNTINVKKFAFNKNIRKSKRDELGIGSELVVGHVGSFSYQKNHSFLIDIFNELHKIDKNSTLLLIGAADSDDQSFVNNCKKKVREYGLERKVKFLGLRTDVSELLQAMDIFLLPSFYEGLPIVSLEAQATGLHCILSDAVTREAKVTDLVSYLSITDAKVWADKIVKIYDETNIDKRSQYMQDVAHAGYDIDNQIEGIVTFYKKEK